MLGWFNECLEKLLSDKFGRTLWEQVKARADVRLESLSNPTCNAASSNNNKKQDHQASFDRLETYPDEITWKMLKAATTSTDLTGCTLSREELLEALGEFFFHSMRQEGHLHGSLLQCQGNTLKDWLSNFNTVNRSALTREACQQMPQFYCHLEAENSDALILHCWSPQGNHFIPFVKGLVLETAGVRFRLDILLEQIQVPGVSPNDYNSWRITTLDPKEQWKLSQKDSNDKLNTNPSVPTANKALPQTTKCPITGLTALIPQIPTTPLAARGSTKDQSTDGSSSKPPGSSRSEASSSPTKKKKRTMRRLVTMEQELAHNPLAPKLNAPTLDEPPAPPQPEVAQPQGKPTQTETNLQQGLRRVSSLPTRPTTSVTTHTLPATIQPPTSDGIGLSGTVTKALFPYHVMIDGDFNIHQVGNRLPALLNLLETDMLQTNVAHVLKPNPISPAQGPSSSQWSWDWLSMRQDQAFQVASVPKRDNAVPYLRFQATIVHVSKAPTTMAMLILTPDTECMKDLQGMNLTLTDLPVHTGHRDLVLAKEQLSTQKNNTQTMEKLQQSLETEKTLLESLLPTHAAEGLRAGKTVEPRLHQNCTFFFSDIVGFTNICKHLEPWQVIEMLNRLYSIMDFLCGKFNIFKIETIGDAYVACSGLPKADPNHARNLANFAVAVNHCTRHVLSPVDNQTPIQLRIGVHTGACASGVVGTTNPRYCVFGDTVNTTSRHESSGSPGMIHCSSTTRAELESKYRGLFGLRERGQVEMKGKGKLTTHWLCSNEHNPATNSAALQQLDAEVKQVLAKSTFKTNQLAPVRSVLDMTRAIRKERKKRMTLTRSMVFSTSTKSLSSRGSNISISSDGSDPNQLRIRPLTRVGSCLRRIGSAGSSGSSGSRLERFRLQKNGLNNNNTKASDLLKSANDAKNNKRNVNEVSTASLSLDSVFGDASFNNGSFNASFSSNFNASFRALEDSNSYSKRRKPNMFADIVDKCPQEKKRDSTAGLVLSSSWDKLLG